MGETMDVNQRIESNIKLVHSVCQKFTGEYEDLFQIGCIGLIKAARTFKKEKGYAFSSYAIPIIRNEILMSLRKKRIATVSLDEPINEDGNGNIITLADMLAGKENVESAIIDSAEMMHKTYVLKSLMSPKYLKVFNGHISGLSQIEISKMTGMSRQMVNKTIMAIRDRGALIDKDYQTGSNSKIKRLGRMPK